MDKLDKYKAQILYEELLSWITAYDSDAVKIYQSLKEQLLIAPANTNKEFNFTFQGSLLVHTYLVLKMALYISRNLIPECMKKDIYTEKELIQICLLHDIGKCLLYQKQGDKFEMIQKKPVVTVTLEILQQFGCHENISDNVFEALKLIRGMFNAETRHIMLQNYNSIGTLTHIIQFAQLLASHVGANVDFNDIDSIIKFKFYDGDFEGIKTYMDS